MEADSLGGGFPWRRIPLEADSDIREGMSHLSVGEEPVAQNFYEGVAFKFAIGPNPRDFALGSFSSQTKSSRYFLDLCNDSRH